jgi:hypothetical protein
MRSALFAGERPKCGSVDLPITGFAIQMISQTILITFIKIL